MRVRAIGLLMTVCLGFAALGVAGCGSSKKHHTVRNAAIAAGAAAVIVHHHHKVQQKKAAAAAAAGKYRAGEFCSKSKESTYSAAGFKCTKVKGTYRLEKA